MRTALEWLNEVGESAGLDMFCGDPKKPGSRTERTIGRIQTDALRWALEQVVPDGNPENVSAKIRAKLNELEQSRHEP